MSRMSNPALALALLLCTWSALANDAAERAAIETAAQAWAGAFNARDADALVALATPDVVLLEPSLPPVSGSKAARAAWQRAMSAKGRLTSATKEIIVKGEVGWRIAAFSHVLPGGQPAHPAQSLEIWMRVGRDWKLHRQMSSGILVRHGPRSVPSEPVLD